LVGLPRDKFWKPTGKGEHPVFTVVANEAIGNGWTRIVSKKLVVPHKFVADKEIT
jgi:hypothetical protein